MSEELKPCPFCGGEAKAIRNFGRFGIGCTECGANFRSALICSETCCDDTIAAWQKRTEGIE